MISKNRIKFVQSLHKKKYRQKYGQFTIEGEKSVDELIHSEIHIHEIFCTEDWIQKNPHVSKLTHTITIPSEIQKISFFNTASPVVAIAQIPQKNTEPTPNSWTIALDGINDPGNLGTIMRIADWYGIKHIVCSKDTVDVYNPKCISATMGSFTRVSVVETDLVEWLEQSNMPKYFCLMEGSFVHELTGKNTGIIVIGSEAHGIRLPLLEIAHVPITIKGFGKAESLNAAVATGIICDRLIQ